MSDSRFRVRTGFRLSWIRLGGSNSDTKVQIQTWRFKFRLGGSNSDSVVQIQTWRFKFRLGGSNSDSRGFKFRLGGSNSDSEVFSDRSLNSLNVMLFN